MKHRLLAFGAVALLASSAHAQRSVDTTAMSKYLAKSYAAIATDLAATAELMPADDYQFRPAGVAKEVRTFAAIVYHIVAVNSWICSMGEGKPDPITAAGQDSIVEKSRLVALVNETNARCTAYLATLTDPALSQVIVSGKAPAQVQAVRGNAAMFMIAHSNEHYGNLVTYLRAKGLVPPRTPVQAIFLSRATPQP